MVRPEEVRAEDRPDHVKEVAQNTVLVKTLDRIDRLLNLLADLVRRQVIAAVGIEPRDEQPEQHRRDIGMASSVRTM